MATAASESTLELDLGSPPESLSEVGTADAVKPPARVTDGALISSMERYHELYQESIHKPDQFWARQARELLTWFRPFSDTAV